MCRACRAAVRTKPLVHGTESGYAKGCKCYSCRRAAADVRAANRHANIERERARDREYKRRKRMAAA
jgi:hypothetical protein